MSCNNIQIKTARKADLYQYLSKHHSKEFKSEGNSLRMANNSSISIKRGYSGYMDFSTGETGNAVDFLIKYLNYSFVDAVLALCGNAKGISSTNCIVSKNKADISTNEPITFPKPVEGRFRQLYAYLIGRNIPPDTIKHLINEGILYQAQNHNNIVFINKERDFAELHGSLSFGKPFHSVMKSSPDRYWGFNTAPNAYTAYICEASIDAISLYLLNKKNGNNTPAQYISLAGVSNQQTINRIKGLPFLKRVILAVDNDDAGRQCRERNSDIEHIIPIHKDWNEDLVAIS